MDKFLMICYVCADFASRNGDVFRIRPNNLGTFVEAPEWVKDTLLFSWLVKDGSIKVADEQITRKQGENDPLKGITAEGKDETIAKAAEEKEETVEEKPTKTRAKRAKKDDAK